MHSLAISYHSYDVVLKVLTELDDDDGRRSPRFTTSVHEVLGVVDTQSRRVLTFTDAVRRRLIDPGTGSYHDRVTGRIVYAADAIRQGLIKTKLLVDLSDSSCAAWLVTTGFPTLPGELGTVAIFQPTNHLALPEQLTPSPTDNAPSYRVRRTISGWLLDL